jgi:hypothetical protein
MLKDSPLQDPDEKDLPTLEELQAQLDLVVSENPNEFTEREPMTMLEVKQAANAIFEEANRGGAALEPLDFGGATLGDHAITAATALGRSAVSYTHLTLPTILRV